MMRDRAPLHSKSEELVRKPLPEGSPPSPCLCVCLGKIQIAGLGGVGSRLEQIEQTVCSGEQNSARGN